MADKGRKDKKEVRSVDTILSDGALFYGNFTKGMIDLHLLIVQGDSAEAADIHKRLLRSVWEMVEVMMKYSGEDIPNAVMFYNGMVKAIKDSILLEPGSLARFRFVPDAAAAAVLYDELIMDVSADLNGEYRR